jgi:hypothetical protein
MIARIWRGVVRLDDADEYTDYLRDTGFTEYAETSGNRGAWMLRRDQGDRTESSPCRCGRTWTGSLATLTSRWSGGWPAADLIILRTGRDSARSVRPRARLTACWD